MLITFAICHMHNNIVQQGILHRSYIGTVSYSKPPFFSSSHMLIQYLYFQLTRMIERANHLTRNVSKIISASSNCSLYERMQLINVLERLCLDHLFKEELNVILSEIYKTNDISGSDLQTTALWFYLLRKHGYQVSPGNGYSLYGFYS